MEKFILGSNIKFSRFAGTLALAALLNSCGGTGMESLEGIDRNTTVQGFFSQSDNAKISGTGRVRFNNVIPNSSGRSLSMKASLDETIANSAVAAIMYSSDLSVPSTNGVLVTFTRSGANVIGSVTINGQTRTVDASRMTLYYPASLDVIIDVHNINANARVLVWRRNSGVIYTPDTADIDSERSGDLISGAPTGHGMGGYTGLMLQNATVSAATIGLPKYQD